MLTTGRESLVVSILSAGTFTGALAGAPISDILGRRWGLQVAMVVFCLGVILQIAATGSTYGMFVAGRVIAGGGVGIVSTIIPMYQSEVAPRWIRGAVVSGYQWAITIGLLIAAIVNNSTQSRPDSGAYRIPIAIQLAFAIILSIGMFILPESPRWYMKVGKTEQAAKALARLNSTDMDDPVVRAEMADIQTNLDVERMHSSGSYMDCFRPNERKNLTRTLVGTSLQGFQQLTGINFIFYYGTTFFKSINAGNPYIFTIASNVVNVVCTIPGMYGMERVGRRKMLIFGAAWMCVMEFMIAIIGTVEPTSNTPAQTSLVALVCLYVAAFASTWGPAAWVVCGEIFPLQIRAKALSLCTASNWLWNFGIGYATPYLVNTGPGEAGLGPKVFFVWGGTCLLCTLFAYFFIIETKGLSLEEVDELYANTTPIKSAAANREVKARRTDLENASKFAGPRDDEEVMADLAKNDVIKSGTHDVDEKNSL
jgi:SP family sugar:H+ symporter-like MFS transporter